MPCDKSALLEFLEAINNDLTKKITLVAAGGTAMTLLDLKSSTIDIDFTIPGIDRIEFEQVLKNNPPGYRVDRWADGHIYCQKLPKDYLEKKHQKAHNIQWITKFKCSKCGKEFDSSSNQLRFCDEDGMRIIAVKEKKP